MSKHLTNNKHRRLVPRVLALWVVFSFYACLQPCQSLADALNGHAEPAQQGADCHEHQNQSSDNESALETCCHGGVCVHCDLPDSTLSKAESAPEKYAGPVFFLQQAQVFHQGPWQLLPVIPAVLDPPPTRFLASTYTRLLI